MRPCCGDLGHVLAPSRPGFPPGLPPFVTLNGVTFMRSHGLAQSGVVAHYRQTVPRNATHLYVYEGGRYALDHVDRYNPEFGPGLAVLHWLYDVLRLR